MLIDLNLLKKYCNSIGIQGICHIGANTCQEYGFYVNDLKINPENIVPPSAKVLFSIAEKGTRTLNVKTRCASLTY